MFDPIASHLLSIKQCEEALETLNIYWFVVKHGRRPGGPMELIRFYAETKGSPPIYHMHSLEPQPADLIMGIAEGAD